MKILTLVLLLLGNGFLLFGNYCVSCSGDDVFFTAQNSAEEFPPVFKNMHEKDFTISFWIYPQESSVTAPRIVDITHNSSEYVLIVLYDDKIFLVLDNSSTNYTAISTDQTIDYDHWYYIQASWDHETNEASLMVDNQLQNGLSASLSRGADNSMSIGAKSNGSSFFTGKIAEFTVWNSAAIEYQLRDHFTETLSGSEQHLEIYYNFEELISLNELPDLSLNGHNALYQGNLAKFEEMDAWQHAYWCLDFDGIDDYAVIKDQSILPQSEFTIIIWIYLNAVASAMNLFSKGAAGYYLDIRADNSLDFSGLQTQPLALETAQWYSIAAVKGSEAELYLNGQPLDFTGSYTALATDEPLWLGYDGTKYFAGKMDEIQIYSSALTQTELSELIYSTYQPHPFLTGWLECNRWDGGRLYDATGNLQAYCTGLHQGISTSIGTFSISENPNNWSGINPGDFVTLAGNDLCQTRQILSIGESNILVSGQWDPLPEDINIAYCIADQTRSESNLIFPEDLPETCNSHPACLNPSHTQSYSAGLNFSAANIPQGSSISCSTNGEEGLSQTELPNGVDYRLACLWYLNTQGTASDISLVFDLEAITGQELNISSAANYPLLWRSGSRDLFTPLTQNISVELLDESTLRFSGSALDSPAGYYTIGAVSDAPLPVTLTSFYGAWTGENCSICWKTCSESNNCGWNIYRGEKQEELLQINPFLIEGAGTTSSQTAYTFIDYYELEVDSTYSYWLESISILGAAQRYGPAGIYVPPPEPESPPLPGSDYGIKCYPNPGNPSTCITLFIPQPDSYDLQIYNLRGQLVQTIFDARYLGADRIEQFFWNGLNTAGRQVSSGRYILQLKGQDHNYYQTITLLK